MWNSLRGEPPASLPSLVASGSVNNGLERGVAHGCPRVAGLGGTIMKAPRTRWLFEALECESEPTPESCSPLSYDASLCQGRKDILASQGPVEYFETSPGSATSTFLLLWVFRDAPCTKADSVG